MPSPLPPPPVPLADAAAPLNRRARLAQGVALATILITPSLYSFHFTSFGDAKLAGLAVGALLLVFVVPLEEVSRRNRVFLFAPLVALLIWAAAVALEKRDVFTFEGSGEGVGGGYALVLLAALLVLGAAPARAIQKFIALSAVPVAILALAQYAGFLPTMFPVFPEYSQRMYSVFGNQDLLGGYLALGLVLGVTLWLEGHATLLFVGGLFLAVAPALALSGSRSAWLAAFVGGALAAWQGRWMSRKLLGTAAAAMAAFGASMIIAPQATWDRFAGSFALSDVGYRIRLWIWDGTIHLIGQHPVAGVGLGNYAYYSPRALGEILQIRGPGFHVFNHIHTLHAHSDFLEIAAESGLVGVALLLVFFVLIPRRSSPAWPALAAAITFSLVNTTLHSAPHTFAFLLLAGTLITNRGPSLGRDRRAYHVAMGFCVPILIWFPLWPSALAARAQAVYEARGNAAESAYIAAYLGGSHDAAYALAILQANAGHDETAISTSERASRGLDTGDLYYVRSVLAERRGRMLEAESLYRECILRWPNHLPAYKGLVRNTGPDERFRILREAGRWLSPEDFAALTSESSAGPARR